MGGLRWCVQARGAQKACTACRRGGGGGSGHMRPGGHPAGAPVQLARRHGQRALDDIIAVWVLYGKEETNGEGHVSREQRRSGGGTSGGGMSGGRA